MPARLPLALLAIVVLALVLSGIAPYDRPTWLLEVFPVLLSVPLLVLTWRRFPMTSLAYVLIAVHALVLVCGGYWTYARVPLGVWVKETFDLARSPYDRLGHFAQGFIPAILVREVLLRTSPLRRGGWLFTLSTAFCLAVAALYELLEWLTAMVMADGATDFLATQGDPWDTQWDLFCALVGAIAAQLLLSRLHDRQIAAIDPGGQPVSARDSR